MWGIPFNQHWYFQLLFKELRYVVCNAHIINLKVESWAVLENIPRRVKLMLNNLSTFSLIFLYLPVALTFYSKHWITQWKNTQYFARPRRNLDLEKLLILSGRLLLRLYLVPQSTKWSGDTCTFSRLWGNLKVLSPPYQVGIQISCQGALQIWW